MSAVELDTRLIKCFLCVFPTLAPEDVNSASRDSLVAWDSLAAITLAAVVQEEFDVYIDLLELAELDSFGGFQKYLHGTRRHLE